MVKLHSDACAKGLIAVMGDTPELVESDSELDFVEVSFGPMCQHLQQCVNPSKPQTLTQYRSGSADVAPLVSTYSVSDAPKRVMSDGFCDAGCGQQPKQVRGQRACEYYLRHALRLLSPRTTSQGKHQSAPLDPVDPGPPKSEPCTASTSCVSPRLRWPRICAHRTSCGSSGIVLCSQDDGSLSQQSPR
jgi:hypothetical protein